MQARCFQSGIAIGATRVALFLVAVLALSGCGILREDNPESLTLNLVSDQPQNVTLVTSTDFLILNPGLEQQSQIELVEADTIQVTSPYDQTFDISRSLRFYVEMTSPEVLNFPVALRVRVDGSEIGGNAVNEASQSVDFVYVFRN